MRTILSRTALAAVGMAALLLTCSAPSSADDSTTPVLSARLSGGAVTPGQTDASTSVQFNIADPTVREVDDLRVTVDTSHLPAGVNLTVSDYAIYWQCSTSDTSITCSRSEPLEVDWYAGARAGYLNDYLPLDVSADPDAKPAVGYLSATVNAKDAGTGTALNTATDSVLYNVAEPVELTAQPVPTLSGPDGYAFSEQYAVTNTGSTTVHGVALLISTGYTLTGTRHSNCSYGTTISYSYCFFKNDLAPGETYMIAAAQGFQIQQTHRAPFTGTQSRRGRRYRTQRCLRHSRALLSATVRRCHWSSHPPACPRQR